MEIISRQQECQILKRLLQSKQAEFLALYGRRRIGKTFLIQAFFSSENCIFFHITGLKNGSLRDQIENVTHVMGQTFYDNAELKMKMKWLDVFEQLTTAIKKTANNKKIVLFFDEFPWMATKNSKLLQTLDYYWNRYWSTNKNVKLIVCGFFNGCCKLFKDIQPFHFHF